MIVLKGFIEKGDNEKFAEITKGMPEAFVMLDSPGGDNRAAIVIGSLIIDNNYATGVRDGMMCNSACTLIWLAGKPRFLDYNSRLGFHSASPSKERRHERDEEGNIQIAFYMRMIGVPQQVIELQPKADPCCFNYVDYKQARAWGLLEGQKLAPGEIAAPSAPSGRQHKAASVMANKVVKAARGDQLPKQMLGNWCAAPKKNRELYSRGSCAEDKGFQINKNDFISMESSCDFKTVKKLPNGSYFVRAECIDKDGLTNEEMVFQIEDGQLEIITTTIRFCVSVIEPPPNVARDPEYSEDKWLALREGPGTQFKIIVKLGSQEELLADDVKGEWTHVSNVTRLSSSDSNKPKIVQGWVRSKYIQRCKETESDEATSQQEPAKSGGAFGQSGPQLHMQEVFPLNPAIDRKNSPILGAGAAFGRPTLAPPIVLDKEFMRTNLHKLGIFSTAKILFHMMAIDGDNVEVREYCGSGCTRSWGGVAGE
jgi:hypothetical protein